MITQTPQALSEGATAPEVLPRSDSTCSAHSHDLTCNNTSTPIPATSDALDILSALALHPAVSVIPVNNNVADSVPQQQQQQPTEPPSPMVELQQLIAEESHWARSQSSGYALLNKAMRRRQYRLAEYIIDRGERGVAQELRTRRAWRANTPLHHALRERNHPLALKLLGHGARHDAPNLQLETPVHTAFYHDPEMVDVMLAMHLEGRGKNLRDANGLTYLHVASSRMCCDHVARMVKHLRPGELDCRINTDAEMYPGYTPLHIAVENHFYDTARILLEAGASIYVQDATGSTPLHLALQKKNLKMINLLLACDEHQENIVNNSGLSHLHAVCASGNEQLLIRYLRKGPHAIHSISQTTYPTCTDYRGYSALHFAAAYGKTRLCSLLLLYYGANCRAVTYEGLRACDLAQLGQHRETADFIRGHGERFERYFASMVNQPHEEQIRRAEIYQLQQMQQQQQIQQQQQQMQQQMQHGIVADAGDEAAGYQQFAELAAAFQGHGLPVQH